jgi:type I restriction-modification system DNA methylase subunit
LDAQQQAFLAKLEKLIAKFDTDRLHYLSKGYSEAQARMDFITPFFKALGWDVENEAGLPHHTREVLVETSEAETLGKPDYSFRLSGQTKFFVEAKAPSEPLDNARHILQAKGYAWNTKQVFFVILTDFEEFRFYDASIMPDERRPDEGLLLLLKYTEYLKNAEKLWEFSKERVAAGSLDAMLPRDRRTQRLRIPPDEAFLNDMTGWREDLARNVFKNNPDLTAKQLNEVVQRLLDRIVFIRIAEDRNIIRKYQLREAKEYWESRGGKFHIFDWLNDLFHRINEDFNGEIFKPHLSESINIDSEVLAKIIERLYPPKSPYRFDVIGVELLGSIYERYLGKTIRPTAKTVRVEEKPEVRKAGGVYYTPKYIVDYIVKNTVGKVIEGKSPKQIEKTRILDPACGSGSFLIGAFQYLIDYHVRYLTEHPKEAHVHPLFPDLIKGENGEPRLSVVRKARILRNNLFGVDIDPQAVEITMMSLYLKALEGEKSQLPPKHALLPELKYNIVCGNSLIGPDIYDQGTLFADEERDRINAFDWYGGGSAGILPAEKKNAAGTAALPPTIPDIMRAGGFDCVIGNPPYIFITGVDQTQKEYFAKTYSSWSYRYDVYGLFIEKAVEILKDRRPLGFITPHTLLNNDSFSKLRKLLLERTSILSVVDIGPGVFEGAKNETMIIIAQKGKAARNAAIAFFKTNVREFHAMNQPELLGQADLILAEGCSLSAGGTPASRKLLEKLDDVKTRFGDFFRINQGLRTGDNEKYLSSRRTHPLHRPALGGRDIKRYSYHSQLYVLYDPKKLDAPRNEANFNSPEKLVVQEIRNITLPRRIVAGYDNGRFYCLQSTNTINWRDDNAGRFSMKYALGVLNSNLLNWYFRQKFTSNNHIASNQLVSLPLIVPDLNMPTDKARHDRMVELVERMLELHRRGGARPALAGAASSAPTVAPPSRRQTSRQDAGATDLEREIAATDAAIDELVYELYGITDDERRIIES